MELFKSFGYEILVASLFGLSGGLTSPSLVHRLIDGCTKAVKHLNWIMQIVSGTIGGHLCNWIYDKTAKTINGKMV